MATEKPSPGARRPNALLLIALAIVVIVFVASRFSGPAAPATVQTPAGGRAAAGANGEAIDPKELDVRIEALKQPGPSVADAERNPFRFRPPPIGNSIKFIGIVEAAVGKIGAFATWDPQTRECRATFPGREGEVIEGRYRVVRIGLESAVLEYLDGRGRTTLPLNGQACVAK